MTALKIDPSRLPYRGEPTKDTRPEKPEIPSHLKVNVIKNSWTKERRKKASEAHMKRAREHGQRNNPNAWTAEQEALMLQMYLADEPYEKMEQALGRTTTAICQKVCHMRKNGMVIPRRPSAIEKQPRWTEEEEATLIRMHNEGVSAKKISEAVGHSTSSIKWRLSRLRQQGIVIPDSRKFNRCGQRKD